MPPTTFTAGSESIMPDSHNAEISDKVNLISMDTPENSNSLTNSTSNSTSNSKSSTLSNQKCKAEEQHQAKLFYKQDDTPLAQKIKTHSLAIGVYLGMTTLSASILTTRWIKEKITCSGTNNDQKPFEGESKIRDMNFIDCEMFRNGETDNTETTKNKIREKQTEIKKLISKHEPVILRNLDKSLFNKIHKNYSLPEEFEGQYTKGKYLIMDSWFMPSVGKKLFGLMKKIFPWSIGSRPVYLARFRGGYKNCVAHVDSGSTYNFYIVNNGKKRVTLIPVEYSQMYKFTPGHDSVYVKGSDDDENFGKKYPERYEFEISEGEILIFNNCAILHKFTNVTGNEDIFTIRVNSLSTACDDVLWNDCGKYANAMHIAKEIVTPRSTREIAYM